MSETKPIRIRGEAIAGGRCPIVCTPLIGASADALLAEVAAVVPKGPDILEWRADYFQGIGEPAEVVAVGRRIKAAAGALPVLFTCRSSKEGGQKLAIDDAGVVRALSEVCRARAADLVDYEIANAPDAIREVRGASRASGLPLVLSYHNFQQTPDRDFLLGRFAEAVRLEADVAKVAVMPKSLGDVLTLLDVTLTARDTLAIPLITMSMGPYGSVSRMVGGVFGSALTFAVGQSSSAPGQVPIEDLQNVLRIVRRSVCGG